MCPTGGLANLGGRELDRPTRLPIETEKQIKDVLDVRLFACGLV